MERYFHKRKTCLGWGQGVPGQCGPSLNVSGGAGPEGGGAGGPVQG